jgi:ABC-2 type transport system ATP-binding protein
MQSVMATVAEDGTSVVLSSHVVAELERVASYLIVLSFGQVTVAGTVDSLVAAHGASLEEIVLASMRESGKEVAA